MTEDHDFADLLGPTDRSPYIKGESEWGFRKPADAPAAILGLKQWRRDAVAAGWVASATYDHEPIESAMRLSSPDGWEAQSLLRLSDDPKRNSEVSLHLWGPDGLSVEPPPYFDQAVLSQLLLTCQRCEATDVPTQRVGFAGRVCEACIKDARKEVERPGWSS